MPGDDHLLHDPDLRNDNHLLWCADLFRTADLRTWNDVSGYEYLQGCLDLSGFVDMHRDRNLCRRPDLSMESDFAGIPDM